MIIKLVPRTGASSIAADPANHRALVAEGSCERLTKPGTAPKLAASNQTKAVATPSAATNS